MTMLTEITEQNYQNTKETTGSYTPSVADRIQRVLYRLEHGEELTQNRLYDGANFCVLGLFADESGLGDWTDADMGTVMGYKVGSKVPEVDELPEPVCDYYNFISPSGDFTVTDLPESTQEKILNSFKHLDKVKYQLSIMEINDESDLDRNFIREVLIEVIRSGVIFNS